MATRIEKLRKVLSPEDLEKAVANINRENSQGWINKTSADNERVAWILSGAFLWYDSPEGHDYWMDVEINLKNK